jgi:hypothetical protein
MKRLIITLLVGLFPAITGFADWMQNPSFEEPLTNGWYVYDSRPTSEIDTSTDFALSGTSSLKIDSTDNATVQAYTLSDNPLGYATPGVEYILTWNYYLDVQLIDDGSPAPNAERFGAGLFFYQADGVTLSAINPGGLSVIWGPDENFPSDATVGAWTQGTLTLTAPADAVFMQVSLEMQGRGSTVYLDDITVVPEPGTALLLAIGGLGLAALRRRRTA